MFGWSPSLYQERQLWLIYPSFSCSAFFFLFCFFQFLGKVQWLIFLFAFFQRYTVVSQDSKVHNSISFLPFFSIFIKSGRLAKIIWSGWISKSQRSLLVSFSPTDSGLCIYHLVKFKFLALFPVDHFAHSIFSSLIPILCCILTFDPDKLAIPKWCTGRKWHIPMAVMRGNRVGMLGWQNGTR